MHLQINSNCLARKENCWKNPKKGILSPPPPSVARKGVQGLLDFDGSLLAARESAALSGAPFSSRFAAVPCDAVGLLKGLGHLPQARKAKGRVLNFNVSVRRPRPCCASWSFSKSLTEHFGTRFSSRRGEAAELHHRCFQKCLGSIFRMLPVCPASQLAISASLNLRPVTLLTRLDGLDTYTRTRACRRRRSQCKGTKQAHDWLAVHVLDHGHGHLPNELLQWDGTLFGGQVSRAIQASSLTRPNPRTS